MGANYKRLTYPERLIIQKMYKKDMNTSELNAIANTIGRERTTVYREIKKNTNDGQTLYSAKEAQKRFERKTKQRVDILIQEGAERKERIRNIWEREPYLTQQQIGERVGCSKTTVSKYLKQIFDELEIET